MLLTSAEVTKIAGCELPTELAGVWNRLAGDVPCRRWEWLAPWWRHYAERGDELFVLVVHDASGEIIGLAPWYLHRSLTQGRVIRFLGSGDVCSDYLTIFSRTGNEAEVVSAVTGFLTGDAAAEWDLIELDGVESADSVVADFVVQMQARDYIVHQQPGENCWRLELPTDWDEYVKSLSKSRRERVRNLVRNYFDSGRAVSRRVAERHELPQAYDTLIELHQKRRRSLDQPGCFADRRFTAYHREVMEQFFDLCRLRLQHVLLDERPVAIEYDLVGGDTAYFYQSGIEPAVLDERPGWLGTIGSLRAAIAEGYKVFDFMRGDEAYKSSWGATACPTVETRIVARRSSAQLRHAAWLARQGVRRWAKTHWRRLKP